jgi:hypothetical protein
VQPTVKVRRPKRVVDITNGTSTQQ